MVIRINSRNLKPKRGGDVTFGNNSKGKIERIGSIGNNSSTHIEYVLLVKVSSITCLELFNYVIKVIEPFLNSWVVK